MKTQCRNYYLFLPKKTNKILFSSLQGTTGGNQTSLSLYRIKREIKLLYLIYEKAKTRKEKFQHL